MLEQMLLLKKKKAAAKIRKVIAGTNTLGVLSVADNLYMRGDGNQGLGNGSTAAVTGNWPLVNSNVADVWNAGTATVILKRDGTWWYTGNSSFTGINNGVSTTWVNVTDKFTAIAGKTITKVALHTRFIAILTSDGLVWGMGFNNTGQFATGATTALTTLTQLTGFTTGNLDIAAGPNGQTLFALKNDQALYGAGDSSYGELGIVGATNTTLVKTATDVLKFWLGFNCVFAVRTAGLSVRGRTFSGQLGNNISGGASDYTTDLKQVTTPRIYNAPTAIWSGTYQTHMLFEKQMFFTGSQGPAQSSSTGAAPWNAAQKTFNVFPAGSFPSGSLKPEAEGGGVLIKSPNSYNQMYMLFGGMLYGAGNYSATYDLLPGLKANSLGMSVLDLTGVV